MSAKTYVSLISLMTAVAAIAVIACVVLTNPLVIGPLGVTLWFVGVLVALEGLVTLLLIVIKRRLFPTLGQHKLVTSSWRQGLLVGGDATMLLALASLRQLGYRDVILLTGLLVLVELYLRAKA